MLLIAHTVTHGRELLCACPVDVCQLWYDLSLGDPVRAIVHNQDTNNAV